MIIFFYAISVGLTHAAFWLTRGFGIKNQVILTFIFSALIIYTTSYFGLLWILDNTLNGYSGVGLEGMLFGLMNIISMTLASIAVVTFKLLPLTKNQIQKQSNTLF